MVLEVLHEETGEGSMQCMNHLYRNSTPGGICAYCLQEKLGKLVSSSFSAGVFPSATSSNSFRSDFVGTATATTAGVAGSASVRSHHFVSSSTNTGSVKYNDVGYYSRKSRLPFILTQRRKKKDKAITSSDSKTILFKRSKSTSTLRNGMKFLNDENHSEDFNSRKRGFWSFRFLSKHSTNKKAGKNCKDVDFPSDTHSTASNSTVIVLSTVDNGGAAVRSRNREDLVVVDDNGSTDEVLFERKVSRSRSVGCGSRSFSGDFFERISTGFGDCTLRRVESQREGKTKVSSLHRNGVNNTSNGQDNDMKERIKCGGIFSGLIVPSSSSSSSSSNEDNNIHGKSISAAHSSVRNSSHVRSKSWGWAFASPMRAFGGKFSTGKRDAVSSKNATPNLADIPSLLAVSG